jgi:hypothetical protein
LDPRTGQVRRTVDIGQLISVGHHVRCYRSKGTTQYLLWPKRGIEFVDLAETGSTRPRHMRCDWTRGECSYGVMPANGLLYVPPHPCVCYTGVALNGFNAFSASQGETIRREAVQRKQRLEQGPAYGTANNGNSAPGADRSADWPMHRRDPARSGSTTCAVPPAVDVRWTAEIGGRLTQAVVAAGKAVIASVDEHTVYCLDAETGAPCWDFIAGGRIDSAPTVSNGQVLFGCRDGWVYCLRAADGVLAWRFRAAPEDRRIVSFGQPESAWGVHGSVVVVDDTVYVAAGRSSFLDGGIWLYGLERETGRILHQSRLDGPWPDVRDDQGQPYHMEGAKTDILVSDGKQLSMFHNKFDLALNQVKTTPRGAGGDRVTGRLLTATSGFLDDTLHDRFYWFHNRLWPGSHFAVRGPKSGHILVFDEQMTYGQRAFSRRERLSPKFTPASDGYLLFADYRDTEPLMDRTSGRGTEYRPSRPPKWSTHVPLRAVAMVLASDVLFLAGPPDVVPADDPLLALEGRAGAKLWAVSTEDGSRLVEVQLDSPPVFDGMSAGGGSLFIAQADGTLTCMGQERQSKKVRADNDLSNNADRTTVVDRRDG